MERVLKGMDFIIGAMMVILVSAMLCIGSAQVFCRYVLESSLSWSEELMRYLYVWIVMVGINLGIRHRGLAAITSLTDYLDRKAPKFRNGLAIAAFAVQLLFFVVMFVYGCQLVMAGKQLAPALRIPMSYIYLAIPVGSGMSIVYTVDEIKSYIFTKIKSADAAPEAGA